MLLIDLLMISLYCPREIKSLSMDILRFSAFMKIYSFRVFKIKSPPDFRLET